MIYRKASEWLEAPQKRVLMFGMSGLGKTHTANMLRDAGGWFHYSVDYRIGTRYMGEFIADNFKREAMKVPLLRELLMTDSVYISSNITFDNLAPLSTYLGKPGDPADRQQGDAASLDAEPPRDQSVSELVQQHAREHSQAQADRNGHGGAGYTTSWGCALEVADLIQSR